MEQKKILDGVRVIDFSRVLAGPFCTAMLADLGAEVIKIESPSGDDQRWMGAFKNDQSLSFELINRNKKSLKLNLKNPEALEIVAKLVAESDVVIENFRPGVTKRLGIDYASLCKHNPALVYCSISGFGQQGPMAKAPSYDVVAQALSGLMSITGDPEGQPVLVGDSVGDSVSGVFAAWAICAALFNKERTGKGGYVDVAMFDSLFSLLPTALANWQASGKTPQRSGSHHPLSAPFGLYEAKDGQYMLAVANDSLFSKLLVVIGQDDLITDSRFQTDQTRKANSLALQAYIEGWSLRLSRTEVLAALQQAGIPCSDVWDVKQAANSEQVTHRQLLTALEHEVFGQVLMPEQPVNFSGMQRGQAQRAPLIGEHTDYVLSQVAGYDSTSIEQFKANQTV